MAQDKTSQTPYVFARQARLSAADQQTQDSITPAGERLAQEKEYAKVPLSREPKGEIEGDDSEALGRGSKA